MNLKEIRQTLNSELGKPLKDYLLSRLKELREIDNIKEESSPTHQAIELKAQKKAYEKLKDILGEIMTIEEMNEEKTEKDQYFSI